MSVSTKPASNAIENEHDAEKYNYRPTTKNRQGRLTGMYLSGAGLYPGVPLAPQSQEEEVMFRIGRGKGGPVELPAIQQDEHGKGFIAQLTPRIHALKHRHGFRIKNRTDYAADPVRSWYWLEVNEDGFPVLNDVPITEPKAGQPQTITPTIGIQTGLFGETPKPEPLPWRDPEMREAM